MFQDTTNRRPTPSGLPPDHSGTCSRVEEPADERIAVQVDAAYAADVDAADLVRALSATLRAEGRPEAEVSLVLTSDEAVAALNLQYLGVAGPTDVLSFSAQEPAPGFVSAPEAANYLGDILIALPFTRRQAAEAGRELRDELRLLAVHGALHLLGYDHADPQGEAAMWARQEAILADLSADDRRDSVPSGG